MIKYYSLVLVALLTVSGCGGGGSGDGDTDTGGKTATSVLVINEVLASSKSTPDWIELKNTGTTTLDISNYGLSDSKKEIKWKFPSGTQVEAGSLVTVWADDANISHHPAELHANLKLKSNKDDVLLYNANDELIGSLDLKKHKVPTPDISIIRNAAGKYVLTTSPTRGAENSNDIVAVSATPEMSMTDKEVTITAGSGATIHYTTDGTDATESSATYSGPIPITETTTIKAIAKEAGGKLVSIQESKTFAILANSNGVVINEIFADGNKDATAEHEKSDWVELYNPTENNITLNGYILSDSKKVDKSTWKLTQTILTKGYLVIFASGKKASDTTHADFKLSKKGDNVVLYNTEKKIIEVQHFDELVGASWARQSDGSFKKDTTPTPNATNTK